MEAKWKSEAPKVRVALKQASEEALLAMARLIYAESQKQVPVDTSRLKLSGRVTAVEKKMRSLRVRVTYGSKQVPYAAWVHENRYKKRAPAVFAQGKEQYLRGPLLKIPKLLAKGAEAYAKTMRKGGSYKSVRAVRDHGPGGGTGSGGGYYPKGRDV